MPPPCIVVANEPRAYREALLHAFRTHYPWAAVVAVEPAWLEDALAEYRPLVVVSSHAAEGAAAPPPVWITLYPDGEDHALVAIAGVRRVLHSVELADLL